MPYWVNVTAFDYGSPKSGLGALETTPTLLPLNTYALPTSDEVEEQGLEVFVYPNPYRFDEDYRDRGYEDRQRSRMPGGSHSPDPFRQSAAEMYDSHLLTRRRPVAGTRCTATTLSDPLSNHDTWDLITRNSQQAVSGLYYWTVEDDDGNTQIGKLVLIM